MPKFWMWQSFHWASATQRSKYARICFGKVLNIFWVQNMPEFWIWQGSEYARVTQGSAGAENVWIGPEYDWKYLTLR